MWLDFYEDFSYSPQTRVSWIFPLQYLGVYLWYRVVWELASCWQTSTISTIQHLHTPLASKQDDDICAPLEHKYHIHPHLHILTDLNLNAITPTPTWVYQLKYMNNILGDGYVPTAEYIALDNNNSYYDPNYWTTEDDKNMIDSLTTKDKELKEWVNS